MVTAVPLMVRTIRSAACILMMQMPMRLVYLVTQPRIPKFFVWESQIPISTAGTMWVRSAERMTESSVTAIIQVPSAEANMSAV